MVHVKIFTLVLFSFENIIALHITSWDCFWCVAPLFSFGNNLLSKEQLFFALICPLNVVFWDASGQLLVGLLWRVCIAWFTLGVRADVQPKSSMSIGAKVEISPQGLYTRS
jgi:hypothetical protein